MDDNDREREREREIRKLRAVSATLWYWSWYICNLLNCYIEISRTPQKRLFQIISTMTFTRRIPNGLFSHGKYNTLTLQVSSKCKVVFPNSRMILSIFQTPKSFFLFSFVFDSSFCASWFIYSFISQLSRVHKIFMKWNCLWYSGYRCWKGIRRNEFES